MCDASSLDNFVLGNSCFHCNRYAGFMFYLYQFKWICMCVCMVFIKYCCFLIDMHVRNGFISLKIYFNFRQLEMVRQMLIMATRI